MGRLFFHVIRRRSKNRHNVPIPADTPASASLPRISFSVMSEVWFTSCRISAACASMRADRRSPPSGPGATEPAFRASATQRIALEALTPKRAAAARHDAPEATAATTRSRRSTESAFDMLTGLLASEHRITSRQQARSQAIQSGRKPL
jgi:hypothetical protein